MHTIEIKANDAGKFDILINETSYRIHRNLSAEKAEERASDIKAEFDGMKQKSRIIRAA